MHSRLLVMFSFWTTLISGFSLDKAQSRVDAKQANFPIVVNTWPFINATRKAWSVLNQTNDCLLAVEMGCTECELLRCDGTVGYGGSPDESSETTLDAMIMDGRTHDVGAVAGLKRIRSAISVARAVMNYTSHTMLVGDSATQFAISMGFKQDEMRSSESMNSWLSWFTNNCQPNFRRNVFPDPAKSCGPYSPVLNVEKSVDDRFNKNVNSRSHDTIGMIAIDSNGNLAGGTSTNGASHKVPG